MQEPSSRRSAWTFALTFAAIVLAACAPFGSEGDAPEAKQVTSSTEAPHAPKSSSDPDTPADGGTSASDGSAGASGPARLLRCGSSTCDRGTGCCVTSQGSACTRDCNGLYFECFGSEDCAAGQVCCGDGKTATCATTCAGVIVCKTADECGPNGTCSPRGCGQNAAYSVCAGSKQLQNTPSSTDCQGL